VTERRSQQREHAHDAGLVLLPRTRANMGAMGWKPFESTTVEAGSRTVLVARHGRTAANEQRVHQGWRPYALSAAGSAAAEAAGVGCRGRWSVDRVISSPVPRAAETARALWGRIDELDAAWGELACPAVEGVTADDAHRRHPSIFGADGWIVPECPPNDCVESSTAFDARILSALRRAAGTVVPGRVVATVTHGAALATLLRLDGQARTAAVLRPSNLTIVEVVVDPALGWRLTGVHEPAVIPS
jgi:broad specificity phosphatase PhoE